MYLLQLGRFTGLLDYFRMDHGNYLTGTIPSQLGMMTQITTHFTIGYASYNSFTGSIPSELGQFTAMDWVFRIASSQLSESIPSELGRMTKITSWFTITYNDLCGSIPEEVATLSSQCTLSITAGNHVGDTSCLQTSALSSLYSSTGGSSWSTTSGWMSLDPCTNSW